MPNRAALEFEIRNVAADDPEALLARLRAPRTAIAARAARRRRRPASPSRSATATPASTRRRRRGRRLCQGPDRRERDDQGGVRHRRRPIAERLGVPVVICGPGSMAQGHRPDEFVTEAQIARCDAMLDALIDRLAAGI